MTGTIGMLGLLLQPEPVTFLTGGGGGGGGGVNILTEAGAPILTESGANLKTES